MYKSNEPLLECERDYYTDAFTHLDQMLAYSQLTWKRLLKCQAWYQELHTRDTIELNIIVLKSYGTIVAIYDLENNTLISRGRYSMTTYQHISKFRNMLITSGRKVTREHNLNLISWFNN